MSGYLRTPDKLVVRCGACPWTNIYFSSDRSRLSLKERGRRGLNAHGRAMHNKPRLGDATLAKKEALNFFRDGWRGKPAWRRT